MGARTSGREAALQMLFAFDVSRSPIDTVIQLFWQCFEGHPEARDYAEACARGIAHNVEKLDEALRKASTNWRLERMTYVDRNVLRLGAWELLNQHEVPRAVILDEAVELAKRFGSEDSGSFVNGVLDRVADQAQRAAGGFHQEHP